MSSVSLVASREGDLTNASIELGGKAGASDIVARRPRPRRSRQARRGQDRRRRQGRRRKAASVSRSAVSRSSARAHRHPGREPGQADRQARRRAECQGHRQGRARDRSRSRSPSSGKDRCSRAVLRFAGKGAVVSQDASAALTLLGFEAPPSAGGRSAEPPPRLRQARPRPSISSGITGEIAGEKVTGTAHFDLGGAKTRFVAVRQRRHHVAALAARRAGGVAPHALDRGDAGRDRRRRLRGLAVARLLAWADRESPKARSRSRRIR